MEFVTTTVREHAADVLPFVFLFIAVALSILALGSLVTSGDPVKRRLLGRAMADQVSVRLRPKNPLVSKVIEPLQHQLMPKAPHELSALRRQLAQAGYAAPSAPAVYYAARIALAGAVPAGVLLLAPVLASGMKLPPVLMLAGASCIMGFMAPMYWISRRTRWRQRVIREGFPDALDMLLVCVEAGLGLDAAVARVGEEIDRAHPILGEQFRLIGLELRAGKSRDEALRNFADRTGVDEISSLAALLIQSEALGASIADALRVHADEMRDKRMMTAEEMAQKLAVKLAIPLIFFIMPALLITILTPGALRISAAFNAPVAKPSVQAPSSR